MIVPLSQLSNKYGMLAEFGYNIVGRLVHLAEGNYLFPEVFDRSSDKIDSFVNYQKSIMHVRAVPKI